MTYDEQLEFMKNKIRVTTDKNKLLKFLDSLQSNAELKPKDKGVLIDEVKHKITGTRPVRVDVLSDIEAGAADIDDIK